MHISVAEVTDSSIAVLSEVKEFLLEEKNFNRNILSCEFRKILG